ncbi:hypothetical protein KIPB_010012, partial [Kipferlia bialata]
VIDNELFEEYDQEFDTHIPDEEKLLAHLTPIVEAGNVLIDHHTPDTLPEDWPDLVVVLRTRTDTIYDRLTERGYSKLKHSENMEAETMGVVEYDSFEYFGTDRVLVMQHNDEDENKAALEAVLKWIEDHKEDKK